MHFVEIQIGWSVLWRQGVCSAVAVLPILLIRVFVPASFGLKSELFAAAGIAIFLVLSLYAFPRIIQTLPKHSYVGFRLTVQRPGSADPRLAYREALLLSVAVQLVQALCIGPLKLAYAHLPLPGLLFPVLVSMPLIAIVLLQFPSRRFHLDVACPA